MSEPRTGETAADPAPGGHAAEDADHGASRRRPVIGDLVVVLGGFLLAGVVGGVLWWVAVDPAMFTKAPGGGSMGERELAERFNGDGWYVVIGTLGGLVAGVGLTAWRSRDLLLATVLAAIGGGLAAGAMALTGRFLGPPDPDAALAAAQAGQQVPVQLEVTAAAGYLVWPMAALVGALVVLWSPPRDPG